MGGDHFPKAASSNERPELLGNHIDSAQSEERRGGKEVLVVGENLGKSVFGGGGKVEGVGSAKIGGGRGGGENAFDTVHDGLGEEEKADVADGNVGVELGEDSLDRGWRGQAFADLTKTHRVELRSAMQ